MFNHLHFSSLDQGVRLSDQNYDRTQPPGTEVLTLSELNLLSVTRMSPSPLVGHAGPGLTGWMKSADFSLFNVYSLRASE